jgi:hypothetical protein
MSVELFYELVKDSDGGNEENGFVVRFGEVNNECEKSFTESGRSEDKSGFLEFDAVKNPFFGENLVGTKFRRDVGKRHVEVVE